MNIEQERADFEAWAKGHYILQRSAYNDTYIDVPTMRAWEVWQARAALASQASGQAAPQKAAPSDGEIEALALSSGINKSDEHWGSRYYTELGSSLFRFARALLSRYGRPAGDAEPVAWVAADTLNSPHPTCISSLAYMSQLDRERGREYVPLYAAPVAAQKADDALRTAVKTAYGYLWHVNNEPGTPNQYAPERAAYEARKMLRAHLTKDERGEGINAARAAIAQQRKGEGGDHD